MRINILNEFLTQNKQIFLLSKNSKKPRFGESWKESVAQREEILSWRGNFGWKLDHCDLIVDVDFRNGGENSFKKLQNDLDVKLFSTVRTRDGFHCYYKKEEDEVFQKNYDDYEGIDFLSKGRYVVIPPSIINNHTYKFTEKSFGAFFQEQLPENLKKIQNSIIKKETKYIPHFNSLWGKNTVENKLLKIDPDIDYENWIKIGMALKSWNEIDGLVIWDEWSKLGEKYEYGLTKKKWKTFQNSDVTMGTLMHLSKNAEIDNLRNEIDGFIKQIENSNEKEIIHTVIPNIKKFTFPEREVEILSVKIQQRLFNLTGIKDRINIIREMLSPKKLDVKKPDWCLNWVFVNSHDKFLEISTMIFHSEKSFNISNQKYMTFEKNGNKQISSVYAVNRNWIDKVHKTAYFPMYEKLIVEKNGVKYINTFNHSSTPKPSENFSEEGKKAVKIIINHLNFICGNEEYAKILFYWICHNVQKKGVKIHWSPVIQSIEGMGKTFFHYLFVKLLGDENVGTVSSKALSSDFNGWAENRCINVIEEIKISGRNRHEVADTIKPLITNEKIEIHSKNVNRYNTINTCNYLGLTNHKDALPLSDDDRRYWIIFVPVNSKEEFENFVGKSSEDYFTELFDSLDKHASEILKFFLEAEIPESFLEMKRAPMTEFKMSMIYNESSLHEGYDESLEILKNTNEYFNDDYIVSKQFFDAFSMENPEIRLTRHQKNKILSKMGYIVMKKGVKIKGESTIIWKKQNSKMKNVLILEKLKIKKLGE